MLDTLCHALYVWIDKHKKGQNSSFDKESEQKRETYNTEVVSQVPYFLHINRIINFLYTIVGF